MTICRTTGAIPVHATHFRSWAALAGALGLDRDALASRCVFSDLHLGAWKGHWIGRELYDQLGLAFPADRQPRIGLHARHVDEARYNGELTDNEGRGDFNTLLAYQLATHSLAEIARRGLAWIVILAPAAPERFGDENVKLINFLAQGAKDAGCSVVLVFPGDAATAREGTRWELRWLDVPAGSDAPRAGASAAGTMASAIPGILPRRFAEGMPRPAESIALPDGRLVLSPLERRRPDQPARELLAEFLEGEPAMEYQWLAAYAYADDVADDDEVGVLFASASHRSSEGGDDVVLRLLDQAKRKTRQPELVGWANAQRQSAVLRLRRWKEAADGPLPDESLHESLQIMLLQTKAWGLVMTNRAAEAEPLFQATRDRMKARQDSKFYLYVLNISALNKLRLGDSAAAFELEKVIERRLAAETPTDWHATYINTINQARLYKKAKDLEHWESYYRTAFSITDGLRSESDLLYTCLCFAQLEEAKRRFDLALAHWLRAAIHWLSSPVPEALAPRVVEAILFGPREEFLDEVSLKLRGYLEAAWRNAGRDPELLAEPEAAAPPPSFGRVEDVPREELRGALGHDGWSVFLGGDARPPRFSGSEYARLARCAWRAMRVLSGIDGLPDRCAIWTDAQHGSDLPRTLEDTLDSAARHRVRSVVFGGRRLELSEAELDDVRARARVALSPAVATVARAGTPVVTFKRYREPLVLTAEQARLIARLTSASTVRSLGGDSAVIRELEARRVLRVRTRLDDDVPSCALATLVVHSPYFAGLPPLPGRDEPLQVSRFAYIRFEGELLLASPRGHAHLILHGAGALRVYHALCRGSSLAALTRELAGEVAAGELETFVRLMLAAAVIAPAAEAESDALRQWQFHDLLLHAESRLGRSTQPVGGTHRFAHDLPPPPALDEARAAGQAGAIIALPAPSPAGRAGSATLVEVLEARRTVREQGESPITRDELGEFLHRTARVVSREATPWPREFPFGGEYTRRPYPNAGSRYELELYVAVNRCHGLERGFYSYDALGHRLIARAGATTELERLLADAARASGGYPTQVLVTIASRFQRCSWKYQGLALSLQLKNVGVLYAHMYLVATAMGLAPCALGAGDSDLFCRLAGTDYLVESSIGELMLGSRPARS